MAVQVVTPQNFQQLIETGKVDEFKAPETPKADAGTKPANGETPTPKGEAPRDASGKFTKADTGDKTTPAAPSTPATGDDDVEDKDLSETVRRKIDKKHRQMKEAEELARGALRKQLEAEQRAESLQRELQAEKTKSGPKPAEPPKEPKPEDFKTVAEYTDALVAFRVDERLAAEKAKEASARENEAKAKRQEEFTKRVNTAREKHDDFDRVLQSIHGTALDNVPAGVTEYIAESELGPELLYHLAKNPDVLGRLQKLSPTRFIAELGKLEAKLEAPPTPDEPAKLTEITAKQGQQPDVSRAPAPIAALSSDKSTVVQKDPKDMTLQELKAHREAERRKQQR